MKMQGRLPLILSILMMTILGVLSFYRVMSLEGGFAIFSSIMVVLYGTWIFVEGSVAAREISKEKTKVDRGTLEFYAVSRGLTVIASLAAPPLWMSSTQIFCGMSLLVIGVVFRLVAIHTLGRFYSHRVRITEEHTIITTGPYRIVRHPAYTGMFFAHLGLVVFFFNWFGLAALLGLLLPSIIVRIIIEEKEMMAVDGYSEYSNGMKRLIPVIW